VNASHVLSNLHIRRIVHYDFNGALAGIASAPGYRRAHRRIGGTHHCRTEQARPQQHQLIPFHFFLPYPWQCSSSTWIRENGIPFRLVSLAAAAPRLL
jgi:hypothetical protein